MMLLVLSLARKCNKKTQVRHWIMILLLYTRGIKVESKKNLGYHSMSRKGRSKSRSRIVCWKCGKKGNLKKDYKSQKVKEGDGQ